LVVQAIPVGFFQGQAFQAAGFLRETISNDFLALHSGVVIRHVLDGYEGSRDESYSGSPIKEFVYQEGEMILI
jgi:hypothetical protein